MNEKLANGPAFFRQTELMSNERYGISKISAEMVISGEFRIKEVRIAMDIKSREDRSRNMSRIRSKNTKPEMFLRSLLFRGGFRYRLHKKGLPGKPDLYLKKYRTVIFINGCFWHRHEGCKLAYMPKSNIDFWEKKFSSNIERDKKQKSELLNQKLRVLTVWECTVRKMMKDPDYCTQIMDEIEKFLKSSDEDQLDI